MKNLTSLVALGLLSSACSREPGSVTQNHTQADFVQENAPFLWAAGDYDSYRQTESGSRLGELPIADDHALTQRVQSWLDRLDAVVRTSHLETTGEALLAPAPVAKVLRSKTMFSAFVAPVEACVTAPFTGSMPEQPSRPGDLAMLQRPDLRPWIGTAYCIPQPSWDAAGLVDFWNERGPRCVLSHDADGRIETGSECGNVWPAEKLAITSASHFIHFSSDLLASVGEDAIVVLAAHELGHYYRAHVSPLFKAKYDFWYEQQPGQPTRPMPAENEAELKQLYEELEQGPSALGGPEHQGIYSPRLIPFLTSSVTAALSEREEDAFVCAAARDAVGPWPSTSVVMRWGDSLGTFLARLDEEARELDDKAELLFRRLSDNHIGWYTTEQEADEIAMDLATKVGLTPERVLAGWLDFMAEYDERLASRMSAERLVRMREEGEVDAATCQAMLEADWTVTDGDGNQRPALVKLGSLFDAHHAGCYRLYRMWSEAKAHEYVVGPAREQLSPAWSELQQLASDL